MTNIINTRSVKKIAEEEANYLYEYPPISNYYDERVQDAVSYFCDRQWTKYKAAQKAGVSWQILNRALKRNDDAVGRQGRPPKVPKVILNEVKEKIHENTLNLNAPVGHCGFTTILHETLKGKSPNNFITPQISQSTLYKYRKDLDLITVKNADIKAKNRSIAFANIRNSLSLCAAMNAAMKIVNDELFFSSDDVSILLIINGWDKPSVLTTKEAVEILNNDNIGVSVTEKSQKRRIVQFNVTISCYGALCYVVKIFDKNFTNFRAPKIYNMDESLYIMLIHSDTKDCVVQRYQYENIIIPEALQYQQKIITRDLNVINEVSGNGYSSSDSIISVFNNVVESPNTVNERFKWIALACDGAYGQINALLEDLHDKCVQDNNNIIVFKYAAGCSMTQSPNDVSKSHNILHSLFKSPSFRYVDGEFEDPPGNNWTFVKTLLNRYLSQDSFDSIWRCLQRVQSFLTKAFVKSTVESAFEIAGIHPFKPEKILSRNKYFCKLDQNDAEYILSMVNPLGEVCSSRGYVPEEDLQLVLQGCDNSPPKTNGMHLNDMVPSRQRAMIFNYPSNNNQSSDSDSDSDFEDIIEVTNNSNTVVSNSLTTPKNTRKVYCSSTVCNSFRCKDTAEIWNKCRGKRKGCRKIFCSIPQCRELFEKHINICA